VCLDWIIGLTTPRPSDYLFYHLMSLDSLMNFLCFADILIRHTPSLQPSVVLRPYPTTVSISALPVLPESWNNQRYTVSATVSPNTIKTILPFSLTVRSNYLIFDQSPIRVITSQVSVNTRRVGVHVLTARKRADKVGVYLIGSCVEALVLFLSKRHDRSIGRDTRVVGADEVLRVGSRCVGRGNSGQACVREKR
jgi:hypothetical protein